MADFLTIHAFFQQPSGQNHAGNNTLVEVHQAHGQAAPRSKPQERLLVAGRTVAFLHHP